LQQQRERLADIQAHLSAVAAEQLLKERVEAAKEQLQEHITKAGESGESVEELTRYLNSLQWEDNSDIAGPMQDLIAQGEQVLRNIQTQHDTCVTELDAAVATTVCSVFLFFFFPMLLPYLHSTTYGLIEFGNFFIFSTTFFFRATTSSNAWWWRCEILNPPNQPSPIWKPWGCTTAVKGWWCG
jgi:uncharacterized membrane protein